MCGIVYGHNIDNLKGVVWQQYQKQKSRGTEGFGLFDGEYITRAATEKRIKRWFRRKRNKPEMLLFHHRYPTSTANVKRAAHPFNTGAHFGDTKYVLVHNGVIRNAKEMREKHEALGITYQSVLHDGKFNDSEALLWEVALYLEGKQETVEAVGDIAFICVKSEKGEPKTLHFARNYGRPLNMLTKGKALLLSSEGKGESIPTYTLYTHEYGTGKLTQKYLSLPAYKPYKSAYKNKDVDDKPVEIYYGGYDEWGNNDRYYIDADGYAVYDDGDYDFLIKDSNTGKSTRMDFSDVLSDKPTESQVNAEYYRLLSLADGVFQEAADLATTELEFAASLLADGELSARGRREINAQKEALALLYCSPDWLEVDSIHPMWEDDNKGLVKTLAQASLALGGR